MFFYTTDLYVNVSISVVVLRQLLKMSVSVSLCVGMRV